MSMYSGIGIKNLINYLEANTDDIADAFDREPDDAQLAIDDLKDNLQELDDISSLMFDYTMKRLERRAK